MTEPFPTYQQIGKPPTWFKNSHPAFSPAEMEGAWQAISDKAYPITLRLKMIDAIYAVIAYGDDSPELEKRLKYKLLDPRLVAAVITARSDGRVND